MRITIDDQINLIIERRAQVDAALSRWAGPQRDFDAMVRESNVLGAILCTLQGAANMLQSHSLNNPNHERPSL